jgi:hypothetical protein
MHVRLKIRRTSGCGGCADGGLINGSADQGVYGTEPGRAN